MSVPHNIYIHVPFCISKCNYCAFWSVANSSPDWAGYATNIISEINFWGDKLGSISVPTIFFGGGTPSLMPAAIFEQIIGALQKNFDITPDTEITLESNPGTLSGEKLKDFVRCGVNRLSVGVQSFDDARLRFLGRRHTARDAINLLNTAMDIGLRVSGDFIYGLPNDTTGDVINTCKQINTLGIQHCSMYELTIEANTPFGKMNLDLPSNDAMADMYMAISDVLQLPRYEVSNYAAIGNECRHNQNVWDGDAYIGIGRGASGRVYIDDTWYQQRGCGEEFISIDTKARATEKIITGLRQVRGVKLTPDVLNIINKKYIDTHPHLLQYRSDNRIAATQRGMLILDDIMLDLIG